MDHFVPNKDIKAAQQCRQARTFARKFDIDNFYDVGDMGVEHALLPEKALWPPESASSEQIHTLAPMAHWAHFPQAWEARTWQPVWLPVRPGSRCRQPSR